MGTKLLTTAATVAETHELIFERIVAALLTTGLAAETKPNGFGIYPARETAAGKPPRVIVEAQLVAEEIPQSGIWEINVLIRSEFPQNQTGFMEPLGAAIETALQADALQTGLTTATTHCIAGSVHFPEETTIAKAPRRLCVETFAFRFFGGLIEQAVGTSMDWEDGTSMDWEDGTTMDWED